MPRCMSMGMGLNSSPFKGSSWNKNFGVVIQIPT